MVIEYNLIWFNKWLEITEANFEEEGGYDWNTIGHQFSKYAAEENKAWQIRVEKSYD